MAPVLLPSCPGTWDLLGKCGVSPAWQESALGEVPPYPTAGGLGGVFSAVSARWDWCCLCFLKLELLKGSVVLVGLLPSFFVEH